VLQADGLAVAQLFGSGGDDLLAVGETRDDFVVVAARLPEADGAPLDLSVAVHEDHRRSAVVDQGGA
jgi:hypothetical protein